MLRTAPRSWPRPTGRLGACSRLQDRPRSRFSPPSPSQHAFSEGTARGEASNVAPSVSRGESEPTPNGGFNSGDELLREGKTESTTDRYMMVGNLKIGTYNCEGFLSSVPYVAALLEFCNVLFLAETWLSASEQNDKSNVLHNGGTDDLCCIQSFAMELPPGVGAGRRHGGVALVCKRQNGLAFHEISCDDARLCGVTICSGHTPIMTIFGCYMPFWDGSAQTVDHYADICGKLDALISAHRPSAPVALIGDFNCALPRMPTDDRPANWAQLRGFSPLSCIMQGLLDDHALIVGEFCFPQQTSYTYHRGSFRTHIDHVAISNSLRAVMMSCRILSSAFENLSPHLPIIADLNIATHDHVKCKNRAAAAISRHDRLKWDSEERNYLYRALLSSRLSAASACTADDLDELAKFIASSIHAAARDSGCARPSRPPKAWWTPSISAARDRCRLWHRIWIECGKPCQGQVHDCYFAARRAYRRARKTAARSHIDQEAKLLHTLRRGNLSSFWKHVGRVRRQRQPVQCALDAELFRTHFSEVHNDSDERLTQSQRLISEAVAERFAEGCGNAEPRVVTGEEVAQLIPRLKRGSAPGPDSVTVEHLHFGYCPELLDIIAGLLTACFATGRVPDSFSTSVVTPILKKPGLDPNVLDNYRPIALTSILSKLLELVILAELELSFVPHDLQFGFAQHRGTTEASLLISETVQYQRRGSPVFCQFGRPKILWPYLARVFSGVIEFVNVRSTVLVSGAARATVSGLSN